MLYYGWIFAAIIAFKFSYIRSSAMQPNNNSLLESKQDILILHAYMCVKQTYSNYTGPIVTIIMAALWNRAGHYIFALWLLSSVRYGDGAGNTVEENSSVFSLI